MDDHVETLRRYNRWRRGQDCEEMQDPRVVGDAIDAACDEIDRLHAELAECKQDAERYRHLLRHHIRSDPDMSGRHHWMTLGRGIGRGATAGEAIDAALKGEGNA